MKMVKIKVKEGRVPSFPENGKQIPSDEIVSVPHTPQIRRMVRDGDIEYVVEKEKQTGGKK